jgi:multicomponent Na+:H+ antiporter subunit D
VVSQLQLLLFSALAFGVLMRTGIYPPELRSTNLDFDWVYRRLLPRLWRHVADGASVAQAALWSGLERTVSRVLTAAHRHHGPHGALARSWPTGSMVLWAAALLAAFALAYYLR